MIIRRINTLEEIKNLLLSYKNRLISLRNDEVNLNNYSIKLFNNAIVLSLNDEGKSVAFAAFYCNNQVSKIGYLSLIVVSNDKIRNGYGTIILDEVINISKMNGMETLELEVHKENVGAIEFYRKNGFIFTLKKTKKSFFMKKDLK